MSDTISIERTTVNSIQRMLRRIEAKLEREELAATVTEEQAANFLGWKVSYFKDKVEDGTIPANAIVYTMGKKRFILQKLVK